MRKRMWVGLVAVMAGLGLSQAPANAGDPVKHHAQSLVDSLRYGPDFKHFDWVNPDAPKGGTFRMYVLGSFDSLNGFAAQGSPAALVGGPARLSSLYDSLFERSADEQAAQYGLIAEWESHPDDYSSVTFGIRPGARFHDGEPVMPEDVIYSMEALKKAHPQFALYYANVVKGEKTGEREVTFTFDSKGNRELPHIVGELFVVPKHYWTANGPDGKPRDISKSTLEVPLGSGPYKIKEVDPGRGITYERVKDYWAKDLPLHVGMNNYDELKFVYFRDKDPAFETFKSGGLDFWDENSAASWSTKYDFDAVKKGLVKKEALPVERVAAMQPLVFNLRRAKFQDVRVRKALTLALNFEELNKQVFYGLYARISSYFDGSELKATSLPKGRELEILNEVKDQVPADVFTTEYKLPVYTAENRRAILSEASKLLTAAGWANNNGVLVNAAGEEFAIEFLIAQENLQLSLLPYIEDLKKLGVKGTVRLVDSSQYKRREDEHDYDMIVDDLSESNSPGNEQRDFWGSAAADQKGSRNTIGIKSPAVDKLIDNIVFAKDRAELVAATNALDRVLLWNYYSVPRWHNPNEWIAYWDIFGRPATMARHNVVSAIFHTWWIDPAKQQAVAAARGN